jgi:hypothetical protein
VMHVPSAVVFHDKRLGRNAGVAPTATEAYGGLLGRMILAGKYARPDVLDETIRSVEEHGDDHQRRALVEYERRRRAHELPIPITGAGDVAEFNRGEYAVHGF